MNVTFTVKDLAAAADAAVPYTMDGDTCLRAAPAVSPSPRLRRGK
jgi:hypothetical protein